MSSLTTVIGLCLLLLIGAVACAGQREPAAAFTGAIAIPSSPSGADGSPSARPAREPLPTQGRVTLEVRDAGEVVVDLGPDSISLVEIRPAPGWSHVVEQDQDPDELEVRFTSGTARIDFEAERDDGRTELAVCARLGGRVRPYEVGDAGQVTFSVDGDELVLDEVSPAAGWTADVVSDRGDELEVEFRSDHRTMDFEAELEDGDLEVEVCQEATSG